MSAPIHGTRVSGMRRHLLVLTLAYLVALQGAIVAWATVSSMDAAVGGGGGVICSQSHHSGSPQGSNDALPCCLCGPMCCASGSPAVGAAPQTLAFVVGQRFVSHAHWQGRVASAVEPAFLSPRQARAPPAMA